MAKDFEHIDENLLIRYILGETSDAEGQEVQSWIELSSENKLQYEEFKKVWESVESKPLDVDVDAAWQKVNIRIAGEEVVKGEPVVRQLERPRFTWYAAAAVVALVGLFTVFQLLFRSNEVQIASVDQQLEQSLNDGSVITLNANSKLDYPKKFKGSERRVKLEGEAFFDVAKDAEKPFVIEAGEAEIKVLGTSFNVEAFENQNVLVHVITGKVQLSVPGATEDTLRIILTPGMTGVLDKNSGRVYEQSQDYSDALFWMDKRLEFDKTPLPEVFEVLERNYKVEFTAVDPDLKKCLLTARFKEDSVKNILSVIEATFDIHFEIGAKTVRIESKDQNCSEG